MSTLEADKVVVKDFHYELRTWAQQFLNEPRMPGCPLGLMPVQPH